MPAGIGSGISAQFSYLQETTWGVCPSASFASGRTLEIRSETLEMKKTTVQGQGLHAGGLFDRSGRRVLTNYEAGGTITCDLPNRNLNFLLQHMTGSPNTTTVGAGSLFTPVQIAATAAWQSYHSPGNTGGMSLSFQKGVPYIDGVTVVPFTYVGCKIVDWEISVATGALAQLTLTVDARNELALTGNSDPLNGSVPTLQSGWAAAEPGIAVDPLYVFHFKQASILTGGTPTLTAGILTLPGATTAANVRSASVKESKVLDTARYFLGNTGFKAEQLESGFRTLSGQFEAEWLTPGTMYNAFSGDTTVSMQLSFVGNIAGTSGANKDTVIITIPNIKLDGESPKVGGPQVVTQACSFTGLDDQLTSPYQIQYISSDIAP